MAVDLSKNVSALFSGSRRTRLVPTLLIALFVTAAVAVPLSIGALHAGDDLPLAAADPSVVLVDMAAGDPLPLDEARIEGSVLISVNSPPTTAVSFNLFAAGSDEVLLASQDLEGPQFDLIVADSGGGRPLDTTLLENGSYQLFLTLRNGGGDTRTAVGFEVANP